MNRYTLAEKQAIRKLRRQGYTYAEIQQEVGYIPKPSLSYICKDVEIEDAMIYEDKIRLLTNIRLRRARTASAKSRRRLLEEKITTLERGASVIIRSTSEIDKGKVALAMLYLGEGRKRTSYSGLSLGGSDPTTLQVYIELLRECYGIDKTTLKATVQYRADQDADELAKYWADTLGFERTQFYRARPDSRTQGKPTKRINYKGVCVITCKGAHIQLELEIIAKQYASYLGH